MKKIAIRIFVSLAALVGLLVATGAIYTVHETEQVVITQFGKPVGDPIMTPGLKFKVPFIQKVNVFEKRILAWDGEAIEMTTRDKTYIIVDTYARWAIEDPLLYFLSVQNERRAQSRLKDILGSATLDAIASHELAEVVRSTKDRQPTVEEEMAEVDEAGSVGALIPIRRGREALESDVFKASEPVLEEYGIKLYDFRFKRINYNTVVQERIHERMISERKQIAERFRSEGNGEAAKILGNMERDLREIESEAYKKVQTLKGEADAKATEIYAAAYNQSPESVEFYQFVRTMELYGEMLGGDSTVVLSTESDLFKYLKEVETLEKPNSSEGSGTEKRSRAE
ncbi:MAG: protease modulator HflC [Verrucomicrobiales bacterium]